MILKNYEDYFEFVEELFEILSTELLLNLPNARIEHIGSSAVEGSISKGDLDVFVGVDQIHFEKTLTIIKNMGFIEKEGTFRSDELCMLTTDKFNYDVAIQLVANGSEFEDFLVFRNKLRTDKNLVQEYNKTKLLAQSLSDNEYREKKNQFITTVLKR